MFVFLLEVVNSLASSLDKFIKSLAPRRCCCVPAHAPPPPYAPGYPRVSVPLCWAPRSQTGPAVGAAGTTGATGPFAGSHGSGPRLPPPSRPNPVHKVVVCQIMAQGFSEAQARAYLDEHAPTRVSSAVLRSPLRPPYPRPQGSMAYPPPPPPTRPTSPPLPIGMPVVRAPPDWRV